ncbi:unnamed protein product [Fusarium graminearum]|nr:unnamed protein product [Fusarium graminearum]
MGVKRPTVAASVLEQAIKITSRSGTGRSYACLKDQDRNAENVCKAHGAGAALQYCTTPAPVAVLHDTGSRALHRLVLIPSSRMPVALFRPYIAMGSPGMMNLAKQYLQRYQK